MTNKIKKHIFKKGLPFEFEIIDIELLLTKNKKVATEYHRTNFYHIIWNQSGNATHYIDFKPINTENGTILFVPKDCVQSFDTTNVYKGKIILFTENFFVKNPNDSKFLQSTIVFNDLFEITQINCQQQPNPLTDLFLCIENEYNKPTDKFKQEILRNYLFNFLLLAEREKIKHGYKVIEPSVSLDYILLFKDILEKNYKSHKAVSEYASELNITEKKLYNATIQIFGKSPKEMIDERLLLEIKRLLAHTNTNVKEIAYEMGFDEPSYFIKYFKKHTNQTPVEFRLSLK